MKVFLFCVINLFVILPSVEPAYVEYGSNHFHVEYVLDSTVCLIEDNECTRKQDLTCKVIIPPYISSPIELEIDSISPFEDLENVLPPNKVPCWFSIQPLSCASYTSICEKDSLFLPFQKMFNITHELCRHVTPILPDFLKSENKKLHPRRCWNLLQDKKLTRFAPFQGFKQAIWVFLLLLRCFVFFLVVLIQLKMPNKYSYFIMCILLCLWLYNKFFPAKKELVCYQREYLRSYQNSLLLLQILYLLQKFIFVCHLILTYALHMLLKQTGIILLDIVQKKSVSIHVPAWNIPVVITSALVTVSDVDFNSVKVFHSEESFDEALLFSIFFMVPIYGLSILLSVVDCLITVTDVQSKQSVNHHVKEKIHHAWSKIGILFAIVTAFLFFALALTVADSWITSPRVYLVNSAGSYSTIGELPECFIKCPLSISVSIFGTPFGLFAITLLWNYFLVKNFSVLRALEPKTTGEKNKNAESKENGAAERDLLLCRI